VSGLTIDRVVFFSGAVVGAMAVAYLLVNHNWSAIWRVLPIKECCVGFVFAAGTSVALMPPLVSRGASLLPVALALGLFGLVCSLNCVSIAVWERDVDLAQAKVSIATAWPGCQIGLNILAAAIVGLTIIVAVVYPDLRRLAAAVGFSAVLLWFIPMLPLSRDERTALADLVLLTPLFVIL
jgi:hypothetical protein